MEILQKIKNGSAFQPSYPTSGNISEGTQNSNSKEHFDNVEEVKQKTAEALKGIKINEFKNGFEQWENVSIGVLH